MTQFVVIIVSYFVFRVPWTSEEEESEMTMNIKSQIIAAKTLQIEWDTQVSKFKSNVIFPLLTEY